MSNGVMNPMRRCLLGFLGALAVMLAVVGPTAETSANPPLDPAVRTPEADALPRPEWIWGTGPRDGGQRVELRTSLHLPALVRRARVEAIADCAELKLRINGHPAGHLEPYQAVAQWDVTEWLQSGENDLTLSAAGTGGPAAVALRLTWRDAEDRSHALITDAQWQIGESQATSYGRVGQVLWEGNRAPVPLSPLEDYTQWKRALNPGRATDPSTFVAPPGFEVDLLHTARSEEGSWVAMAFDPQGRLTVALEQQGLLRLSLDRERRQVSGVEQLDDTLAECRGLLYSGGHLYANANNNKTLFRLSDTTGDGRIDRREPLLVTDGGVGHGRNDIASGPAGELYVIHGDDVDLPRDVIDLTSPAREHRRGESTREGHLLRIDRQGGNGVIVAAGLRNPYGIALNRDGEAFTYDADAEYDMGAPWYRPTRVNHLIAGADFGWRGITGGWPPYYPDHCDNAPSILDVGRGSPTAISFATGGQFPSPYDEALFILDWAYGRVIAVRMEPRGSSYACRGETFLQGRPLNVTDLQFGPDGAMYLITGGRNTQSALYRVRYVGPASGEPELTPQQEARRRHAEQARRERHTLQQLLASPSADGLDDAWESLADADPWLRYVARTVVEHRPLDRWSARALQEERPSHAAAALLALARCDVSRYGAEIARSLAGLPLESLAPREQMMALYTGWLCLRNDSDDPAVHAALRTLLEDRYPSGAATAEQQRRWNLWASRILVRIAPEKAVPTTVELLRRSGDDQHQQLHYLFVLRTARKGWSAATRRTYFLHLRDAEYFEGGAGMLVFLARIRSDALESLGEDERAALADLLEAEDHQEQTITPPRPLVHRWTPQELEALLTDDRHAIEPSSRSRARGERLFDEAQCASCHRFAGRGRPLGPDLTHVARRFSPRDLLQSIARPSEVVAEQYRNVQIVTEQGEVHVGRVLAAGDFREPVVRLVTDLMHPERVMDIDKQEIAEYRQSPLSPMPEGLLDTLTGEEILDLLAYLTSAAPAE